MSQPCSIDWILLNSLAKVVQAFMSSLLFQFVNRFQEFNSYWIALVLAGDEDTTAGIVSSGMHVPCNCTSSLIRISSGPEARLNCVTRELFEMG
jgi:hypothetical protein